MINNPRLETERLIDRLKENCVTQLDSSHVLCIQDTTEINYSQLCNRLKEDPDVGPMSKDSNIGFFCHPTLVVDAESEVPLGFSHLRLWNRSRDKADKKSRNYRKQKITDKESYRWIESARESARVLPHSIKKTIIADRESDIYEALYLIPQAGCEFLIRSSANRKLDAEDLFLLDKMRSLTCMHTYELQVKGNHSRKNRRAKMELRYGPVTLSKPESSNAQSPDTITVNCIYLVEKGTNPVNESPIEWRLLTTHPIDTIEQAMQCVQWYKLRWYIEEIFRLLKSEGMDIEAVQLESGEALKKMLTLSLAAALQIMSLKISYDKRDERTSASLVFTKAQIALLKVVQTMVEGKTAKQKNPFKVDSLAWAAWIIARLGSWDGYTSQGAPGYITFRNGMERLGTQLQLFLLLKGDV